MTIFLDGPAQNDGEFIKGTRPLRRAPSTPLLLKRAPHFLRAVQAPDGTWDALDQLHDTPKPDETIVAYEMVGEPSWCHINARGKKGERTGGVFHGGRYTVCDPQPTEAQLRDTPSWRLWCAGRIGKPIAPDGTVTP